jgi:hypothetical protein
MNRFLSILVAAALPLSLVACAQPGDASDATAASTAHVETKMTSSDRLLTETLMRQILTKKLLRSEVEGEPVEQYQYDILEAALEGPGNGNVVATVYSIECERALGSDECVMGVGTDVAHPSPNDDETEAGYELRVRVYQGDVVDARLVLTAG